MSIKIQPSPQPGNFQAQSGHENDVLSVSVHKSNLHESVNVPQTEENKFDSKTHFVHSLLESSPSRSHLPRVEHSDSDHLCLCVSQL